MCRDRALLEQDGDLTSSPPGSPKWTVSARTSNESSAESRPAASSPRSRSRHWYTRQTFERQRLGPHVAAVAGRVEACQVVLPCAHSVTAELRDVAERREAEAQTRRRAAIHVQRERIAMAPLGLVESLATSRARRRAGCTPRQGSARCAGVLQPQSLHRTWIAVIPGLSAKSADGASAFSYPLIFLPFISAAFVPTDTMPGPVRAFADNQPVTSIVNAIRDVFTQQPVGTDIWIALAWCVGVLIVAYTFAMLTYRRRIS